ncbi:hypothetical protein B7C42_01675 [Nocardia cerradoensis]|uniref:Uncharacterized protein n=1 Tax=Nocardia cerradoensis TaxID=85688 RepID=A0A231HCR7_9NOCA|nr:hypothetical protein [Nocardia cerradoensis]OXR46700.1 hypothetical protein B7C42_01675 [Nocardia cerradoensis]
MNTGTGHVLPARIALDDLGLDYVVTRAITEHMNGLARSLSPLTWRLDRSPITGTRMLSGIADPGSGDDMAQWALALGLERGEAAWSLAYGVGRDDQTDKVTYSGTATIDHQTTAVRVWCYADQAAREAAREETARIRARWDS